MKIAVAQSESIKGDIESNISNHLKLIELVESENPTAIFFPELSITGYEPELAAHLATTHHDKSLDVFQELSDKQGITIGVGLPTIGVSKPHISMAIFQPLQERITYSKQYLHADEDQYFSPGDHQSYIEIGDYKIAPAICYESSVEEHNRNAMSAGANIYIASVLDSVTGIDKGISNLSKVARDYKVTVLLSNYVGVSGGYDAAGMSSVWNNRGDLIGQLDNMRQGVLILDTENERIANVLL